MYNLNEMSALSLLKSAEEEKTLYPGLPRGLIAVLFYYDSREQFANAFKTLVQARQGISWTLLEGNEEISLVITRYLSSILDPNTLDKLLDQITKMEITKELELLQQNRAVGDARHRKMVLDKFKSVRSLFADIIFCWSAQTPLNKDECRRLIGYLSRVKISETGDGSIDSVTLTILMALLYSIESGHLLAVEDLTDSLSSFPITSDKSFVADIHRELKSDREWECRSLKAVVQFAWCVSLSNLRQVANNIQLSNFDEYIEDDEFLLNEALNGNVFKFLEKSVLCAANLPLDQFYYKRLHSLFADFIHKMPERIKMMKTKADENAQSIIANLREGLQVPSNLDQPFEQLLLCLSSLYGSGDCAELVKEYWMEGDNTSGSRHIALRNFVQLPRDFLPHSLFIPYIKFLTSLCSYEESAQRIYDYLRFYNRSSLHESNLSWDHFISALSKYYQNLRIEEPTVDSIYRSSRQVRAITPQELEGLVSVLQLMAAVATHDETARVELGTRSSYSPIELCVGLLTCRVPMSLKTQLIRVLTAFSISPSIAMTVWQCLEAAAIVPSNSGAPGYSSQGIRQDIEEVESSAEEFPLSQSFINLLIQLVESGVPGQLNTSARSQSFTSYISLVIQHIFIPHDSRTYRRAEEKWKIALLCCKLFHKLVLDYKPVSKDSTQQASSQSGYQIMIDMVHDSNLLKQILNVLHDAVHILEQHTEILGLDDLQSSVQLILEILLKVLKYQRYIVNSEENGPLLLIGLDKLLLAMNPRSGNCDHMLNITRVLGHHALLPKHASFACELLTIIGSTVSGHKHLMPLLTAPSTCVFVRQYLVQLIDHATLDTEHIAAAKSALLLFKAFLSLPAPNLGHFLFGFLDGTGIQSGELRTDLLEPGVRGFPRTALHAVLSALPSLPPLLSELAHSLLLTIATHHSTSDATLRYLSSRDFIFRSLSCIQSSLEDNPLKIQSVSWILHLAALDLRYHASHQQMSQLNRLINLLVSGGEGNADGMSDNIERLAWVNNANGGTSNIRGVLLTLLEVLELNVDPPAALQCQFLTRAPELIKACEEGPQSEINIELLYQNLSQFLMESGAAGAPITQKAPLEAEMQTVLDHALARNAANTLLQARRSLTEAWGQLVEVTVTVTPSEVMDSPSHKAFLHTITLELLRRVLDDMARPDLTSLLISTVLILVTTLKNLYSNYKLSARVSHAGYMGVDGMDSAQVPSSLVLILRHLVDCVSRFRHSQQSVRANVYAALLNFSHIHSSSSPQSTDHSSLIIATSENSIEQYQRESYDVVKEELPQLLSVLCCEATAGHHLCRMLSITCLSSLSALEVRANSVFGVGSLMGPSSSAFLDQLNQQGQLRRILDGIEQDDRLLINLVNSGGDLRPLYVWEARCALLSQLALSSDGARVLLQSGLMARFSKLGVLSAGVDVGGSVLLGVVKGALRVCEALVSSLTSEDWSAGSQVAEFLGTHMNIISEILQPPSQSVPFDVLTLVSGVVASTAAAGHKIASVGLLYQHLLNMIPHMLPPLSNSLKEVYGTSNVDHLTSQLQTLSACMTSCSHYMIANPLAITFQPSMDSRNHRVLTLGTLLKVLNFASSIFSDLETDTHSTSDSSSNNNQFKKKEVLQKQREICANIAENCTFILWRHLCSFLQQSPSSSLSLQIQSPSSLSLHRSLALPGTPDGRSLTASQMATLKDQVNETFLELLPGLQKLHQNYGSNTSHVAFLPALCNRIRKILVA